ncbi:hypothetical protein [Streptomyces sp. NBC_01408]|nr:hypothetical protein [Streptomyces sp. NBC_01408]MCX4691039.1 hypothetical protein [Streptomyces sp. NBC_01408]
MTPDTHEAPDSPWLSLEVGPELSQELLDRALVGWERFLSSIQEPTDG